MRLALHFNDRRPESIGPFLERALQPLATIVRAQSNIASGLIDGCLFLREDANSGTLPAQTPLLIWDLAAAQEDQEPAPKADFYWVSSRRRFRQLQERGHRVTLLRPGCDPTVHRPRLERATAEVLWIGDISPEAQAIWSKLQHHNCCHVESRAIADYGKTRSVILTGEADRPLFEALGCQRLAFAPTSAIEDDLGLRDGQHLVTYECYDELREKVNYYLAHPRVADKIASAGHDLVLARHTYRHRAASILAVLKARQPRSPTTEVPSSAGFGSLATLLVEALPRSAHRILQVGAFDASVIAQLRRRQPLVVEQLAENDLSSGAALFPPASFDAIIFEELLEAVASPLDALNVFRSWLRPGGLIVGRVTKFRHADRVRALLAGDWDSFEDRRGPRHPFTRRELEKLLYRARLEKSEVRLIPGHGHADWIAEGKPAGLGLGSLQVTGIDQAEVEEFYGAGFVFAARSESAPPIIRVGTLPEIAAQHSGYADWGLTSIIVPVVGPQEHALDDCLTALSTRTDELHELIVIRGPDWTSAVLQGLRTCQGRQVAFVASDVIVTTGWLRRLLELLDSEPNIGAVGPCLTRSSGPQQSGRNVCQFGGTRRLRLEVGPI